MCEPSTILAAASFAVTAASAVVSYQGQEVQAKTQMQLEQARHDASVVSAFAAARDEQNQLSVRQEQEQDASAFKVRQQQMQEAEAKAEARVKSVANNVAGVSVDSLIADLGQKAANNREVIRQNANNVAYQLQQEQNATLPRAQSRIYMPGIVNTPTILTPLLQIAGAGVQFGKDMDTNNRNDRIDQYMATHP